MNTKASASARTANGRPPVVATRQALRNAKRKAAARAADGAAAGRPPRAGRARGRSQPSPGPRTPRSGGCPRSPRAPRARAPRRVHRRARPRTARRRRASAARTGRSGGRAAHASLQGSTVPRRRRRPRRRCVFTVGSGRSVWRAISSSDSSPKKRSVTVSRYGSGRVDTAARSVGLALGAQREHRGIGAGADRDRLRVAGRRRRIATAGHAAGRRVEPADGAPLADLAQGDADRDAGQPRTERALAAPARERSVGGHERLLRGVLGLVEVAEDPMAGPDDRRRFALDQMPIGITVAGEDGVDDGAVTALVVRTGRGGCEADGSDSDGWHDRPGWTPRLGPPP